MKSLSSRKIMQYVIHVNSFVFVRLSRFGVASNETCARADDAALNAYANKMSTRG